MGEEINSEIVIYGIDNLSEDHLYVFLNTISDIKLYNMVKINSIPLELDRFKTSIIRIEKLLKEVLKIFDAYNNDIEINFSTQDIYVERAFKTEEKEYEKLKITIESYSNANGKETYVAQAGLFNLNKYTAQIESNSLYTSVETSINALINYINDRIDKYSDILDKTKNIRMNKAIFVRQINKLEIIRQSLKNILSYAKASYEKSKKLENNNNIMEKVINEIKRDIEQW